MYLSRSYTRAIQYAYRPQESPSHTRRNRTNDVTIPVKVNALAESGIPTKQLSAIAVAIPFHIPH